MTVEPMMGGEDFSAYLEKAEGCFFGVGSGSAAAGVAAMAPRQVSAYHHRGTDPAAFAEKLKAAGAATEVIVIDWYPGNDDPTGKKPD